ncbi:MAG: hypothetical protein HFG57_04140 [Lachnospiraceae bacterium]|nr:hypothetical protein [Lachnospiraceae bacterium]
MNSKKKLMALAGLAVVTAVGGSLAYFNQTLTAENIFDTGTYNTELVEEFKPSEGENWEPGATVNKDVTFKNTGTLPVVVRVKFQEKWVSRQDPEKVLYEMDTTRDKTKLGTGDARNKFENVYQGDPSDGLTGAQRDDSVVYKHMIPDGKWIYNEADGYYYYLEILPGVVKNENGEEMVTETTKLLDGVTLAENIDMGAYWEGKYYAVTKERPESGSSDWIEFATRNNAEAALGYEYLSTREMNERLKAQPGGKVITFMKSSTDMLEGFSGYSQADYTLLVTAQTVQATNLAVKEAFGDLDILEGLGCTWVNELMDETQIQAATDEKQITN